MFAGAAFLLHLAVAAAVHSAETTTLLQAVVAAPGEKHIDWYCGSCSEMFALNESASNNTDLVDGIMPVCELLDDLIARLQS